jgi:hypothetical protein
VGPITRKYPGQPATAIRRREQAIVGAEGEEQPGAIVYPDDPTRRLAIVWG